MLVSGYLAVAMGALAIALWVLRRQWERWWFELEDPRSIAAFRVVLSLLAICNVEGLREHFDFLFTADGILTGEQAGRLFAPRLWAADTGWLERGLAVVTGPFSLLYWWDDRVAAWLHLAVFETCAVLFMIGLRTRIAGIAMFLAMDALFVRNFLFWEGTELVFRVFLAYLVCSRCGHAYSVDEWLRRRRSPDAPPCRLVPAWPRRLMLVQMAIILGSTGMLKSGVEWIDGNAVYYALSSDHYARFPMQELTARFGTNVMRLLTWGARTVEALFPLVLVGIIGRWAMRDAPPIAGARVTVVRVCLLLALVASTVVVATTGSPKLLPVHGEVAAAACWVVVLGGTWGLWWSLGRAPIRLGTIVVDRELVARWLYGRRIWVTAAAGLMLGMWLLMNIGLFHPAMLAALLPMLAGREAAPSDAPLAYSTTGRRILSVMLAWHVFALAVAAIPASPHTEGLREPLRRVTLPWLQATRTQQSWGMWAPNPRMDNPMLQVLVTDADGREWDMQTDLYAPERRSSSIVAYDRFRKIAGRILQTGPDGPYQRAYAGWHCRQWARAHDGRPPRQVELRELSYRIPTPEQARDEGPYSPAERLQRTGTARSLLTHTCG